MPALQVQAAGGFLRAIEQLLSPRASSVEEAWTQQLSTSSIMAGRDYLRYCTEILSEKILLPILLLKLFKTFKNPSFFFLNPLYLGTCLALCLKQFEQMLLQIQNLSCVTRTSRSLNTEMFTGMTSCLPSSFPASPFPPPTHVDKRTGY